LNRNANKAKQFKTFFMSSVIVQGISVEEFIGLQRESIRNLVKTELTEITQKELKEKFLSPEETCKLFTPAISKPTLESYSKKYFKKHYLGGRTWYKYSEVIEAIEKIKKYSR
jgi:hypothetical protein